MEKKEGEGIANLKKKKDEGRNPHLVMLIKYD